MTVLAVLAFGRQGQHGLDDVPGPLRNRLWPFHPDGEHHASLTDVKERRARAYAALGLEGPVRRGVEYEFAMASVS